MRSASLFKLALAGLAAAGLSSCTEYENPQYSVLEKQGSIEIRQYEPMLAAETRVDSTFGEAGNVAFSRLYDYISGNNRSRESIAMTAPVTQEPASEKIPMTAPVTQEKSGDQWTVAFIMPSKYTPETVPEPTDERVTLREIPARKMAAIRYSGSWSRSRYDAHLAKLEGFLREKDLTPAGEPVFARYDPPFQLFFLRRNEVLIPVE